MPIGMVKNHLLIKSLLFPILPNLIGVAVIEAVDIVIDFWALPFFIGQFVVLTRLKVMMVLCGLNLATALQLSCLEFSCLVLSYIAQQKI